LLDTNKQVKNNDQTRSLIGIYSIIKFSSYDLLIIVFIIFNIAIDEGFELKKGWTLKSNQKYGKKGAGKRMTTTVKSYLESYFLAGNINKTDRMTAKDMVEQLQILADEGEIQVEDVPEITKVSSWITRYAASLKKHSAETIVEGSSTTRDINNNFQEITESSNEKSRRSYEKDKKAVCGDNNSEQVIKRRKKNNFKR